MKKTLFPLLLLFFCVSLYAQDRMVFKINQTSLTNKMTGKITYFPGKGNATVTNYSFKLDNGTKFTFITPLYDTSFDNITYFYVLDNEGRKCRMWVEVTYSGTIFSVEYQDFIVTYYCKEK